jgi:transcriptional regulator with XRE-family HTH domain
MRGDLTPKEQRNVRTALRFLRLRAGAWVVVAEALRVAEDTIEKVINGRRNVTASMALRVARVADVSVDDVLAGRWPSPRTCPHCGHPPDDFAEDTFVGELPPRGGLRLVRED